MRKIEKLIIAVCFYMALVCPVMIIYSIDSISFIAAMIFAVVFFICTIMCSTVDLNTLYEITGGKWLNRKLLGDNESL